MNKPLVSVVIPTYNSEKTLGKCLESIKKQSYKNIETIVVDKFSSDGTKKLIKKMKVKLFELDAERTTSKNFGLKKAIGKYITFIDSDMELTKNVIAECVKIIENDSKIGGVIIPERSIGTSYWVKVRDFERSFYENTSIESARFFKKDLVEKV